MATINEILSLKKERHASILAHNYQIPQVQDVADLVGDSLELSRAAARLDCDFIIFCGVDFMAETAAILSPQKTVVMPARGASCPMAHMITPEELRDLMALHPKAAVVCYVNSTAEIKAESDICCTSANGVEVVNSLPQEEVIFVPDRNLAAYVARHTKKKIIPWDGYCYVHDNFTAHDVISARVTHPEAEVLVHPECRPEVIDQADYVYSTAGMGRHAKSSTKREFIIGTEVGMIYRLKKENPDKEFYPLSMSAICQNMKKTDLALLQRALETLEPRVNVPEQIAVRARRSIERMLAVRV
ncbi:MAG: quinolinate synthase NadA [Methanothrix sp.]|jgi:quinolinate synthase|nr:quinolinate synthase NadA [Methanothrix sp.]